MEYLLGIDIGTTGTKSALFSSRGELVDIASCGYGLSYPREGWVEQRAGDWWDALVQTVRELVARNRCADRVAGMSLSTQGGALVLLDEEFNPIADAVSWLDTRAKETADILKRQISVEEIYRTSGWPILNSLNFPNILWFREKRPDLFKRARFFASTVDYIGYLLTGRFVIDPTNLALTLFLDLDRNDFSEKALGILGVGRERFPEVVPSGRMIGKLNPKPAKLLGLGQSVAVVSGAQDQYCASIGAGAVEPGDCVLSCGTAWVLLATCDKLYFNDKSLAGHGIVAAVFPGPHPIEGKYGLMTSVPFGGNSLAWFRDTLRPGVSYDLLNTDAAGVPPGSEGLIFYPIQSSKSGKGAFVGIDGVHTMRHFTRAVYEGIAFLNRRHLDMIRESGVQVQKLIMIGGGAKSPLWPRIVAEVCGVPVTLPKLNEAACAGAAVLAGVGSGLFRSIVDGSRAVSVSKKEILPTEGATEKYREMYERYMGTLGAV